MCQTSVVPAAPSPLTLKRSESPIFDARRVARRDDRDGCEDMLERTLPLPISFRMSRELPCFFFKHLNPTFVLNAGFLFNIYFSPSTVSCPRSLSFNLVDTILHFVWNLHSFSSFHITVIIRAPCCRRQC